jgi:hypothetical protein
MTGPYKSRPISIVRDGVRLRQQNKFIFSSENLVGLGWRKRLVTGSAEPIPWSRWFPLNSS